MTIPRRPPHPFKEIESEDVFLNVDLSQRLPEEFSKVYTPEEVGPQADVCALMLKALCRHYMQGPFRQASSQTESQAAETQGAESEVSEEEAEESQESEESEEEGQESEESEGVWDGFCDLENDLEHMTDDESKIGGIPKDHQAHNSATTG